VRRLEQGESTVKKTLKLNVNGIYRSVEVDPEEPLLWVLRDTLELTGAKFGCGVGICGACSVLIDKAARRSCIVPVGTVASGQKIVTIEGLAKGGALHPVQKAFLEHDAFCCGFCTPGMIITAVSLLNSNPMPTREQIIEGMNSQICRCGSYMNIIAAVEEAARATLG
jgi:aerobic-type carbon monoxide dehydrogenase small subunit (CoxS/CutS family)